MHQPIGLPGDLVAQCHEQLVFALVDPLLGAQHLLLVFFQLGRGVAFGVFQSLLPLVVGRDLRGMDMSDLDVVAEDAIETDLEARDSGTRRLARLKLGDPLLAPLGDCMPFVQLRVMAAADNAPLARAQWQLVGQSAIEKLADIRTKLQPSL